MKRLTILVLIAAMALSMFGCGKGGSDGQKIASSEEILTKVWDTYAEDDKFPTIGGGYENTVDNAPGKVADTDTAALTSLLYVPESELSAIDDTACMIHMMNANTFTSAAFHLADSAHVDDFVSTMKDTLLGTHFICGAPQRLVMAKLGADYVVCAFGAEDLIDAFKTALLGVYAEAELPVDVNFME